MGIDDSMRPGLRGPSNMFAHPTDKQMETVESEFDYLDDTMEKFSVKIVFGHFPMSFTASSMKGKRYEDLFVRKSVSSYLCGHLHAKFSDQLWKLHSVPLASQPQQAARVGQFWEWELGDWKESRLMRIFSLDNGDISFIDIKLDSNFQTAILITHPLNAINMIKNPVANKIRRNHLNALVFSSNPIHNVTAKIYDGMSGLILVEELPMFAVSGQEGPLFRANMELDKYKSASGIQFWIQVVVIDFHGLETSTKLRPFSVEGERAYLPRSFMEYVTFHIRWETLYFVLLKSNIIFLFLLLFFPKMLKHLLKHNSYRNKEISTLPAQSGMKKIIQLPIWFSLQCCSDGRLWWPMLIYLIYLLIFPWFWGYATSEHHPVSYMFMVGWTVTLPGNETLRGVGIPDVMTTVLPFMYLVIAPIFILTYSLIVERAAGHAYSVKENRKSQEFKHLKMDANGKPFRVSVTSRRPHRGGWTRITLLVACFVIMCIHFKICANTVAAFGAVVLFSPAFVWAPPILTTLAVYLTKPPGAKCNSKI